MWQIKNKMLKIVIATIVMVSTAFNPVSITKVSASERTEIAGWNFSGMNPITIPVSATSGTDVSASVTTTAAGTPTIAGGSQLNITGWSMGAYWEFTIDTTDYEDITFTVKNQSSNTGPRDWELQYSIDNGNSYESIEGSAIESANSLGERYSNFLLPIEVENQSQVKIRMVVTSDDRASGSGTIADTGTSRIGDVSFKGVYTGEPIVTPEPPEELDEPELPTETTIPDPITSDMVPLGAITIDEVYTSSGEATVVGQIAYAFGNSGTTNSYLLQDVIDGQVRGLQIFGNLSAYQIGDIVAVTGTIGEYGGITQISSISNVTKLDYTVSKFPAQEVTLSQLLAQPDNYLSEYVVIKGVTLGAQLADGSNNQGNSTATVGGTTMNIYRGAMYPDGVSAGDVVDLYASFSKFNTTYQLRVGSSSDYVDLEAVTVDSSYLYTLADFAGTVKPTTPVVHGDLNTPNDGLNTNVKLTHSTGNTPVATIDSIGFSGMMENQYYQLELNSKLCGNITLSYSMRGSGTGPRDFQIYYSTDGTNYTLASNEVYKITTTGTFEDFSVALPELVNNTDNLYIRIQVASGTNINGGIIGGSGTNYLQEIKVTGNPLISDSITRMPQLSPARGEVLLNDELTMVSETTDAKIYYSFDGGNTYDEYDSTNKPVLATLPASVTVYASKTGLSDSLSYTHEYTQAQVTSVRANPNGGAIVSGSKVNLSTVTPDAKILYSLDDGSTWLEYNSTDRITMAELPATMLVKAVADGYIDSVQTTLLFTERQNEKYNIYYGQLHSHTNYSDGSGSIDDAYNHATNANQIDFLAVTDHSNQFDNADNATISDGSMSTEWVTGTQKAIDYTTPNFVGLFGYEMTWSNGLGHINTFNTPGFQHRNQAEYSTRSTALQNYYQALKSEPGSISQFNHPGTTFGDFSDFAHFDDEIAALIPLIEVGNGEGAVGSSGYFPSYQYYDRALDKGWYVAPTNNQDNHKMNWGDSNTARTVILADTLDEDNVYDALRNRRVYASEDNDIEVYYTLDNHIMGTILDEDSVGETISIEVDIKDPTDSKIGTVQIISNGGIVSAQKVVETNQAKVEFELPVNYSYYYVKIIQADGDIIVTAPVWIGKVEAVGISDINTATALQVAGESLDINLELFNNEENALLIEEITFTIDGELIHSVDLAANDLTSLASFSTKGYSFDYTHLKPGKVNVEVTLTATLDGVQKVYTNVLQLNYVTPDMVTRVIVDGTHYNDYVTGYYGGRMGSFTDLAAHQYAKVEVVSDEITREMLENCDLLIISAPAKRSGTDNAGPYNISHFEQEFIDLVVEYAENGGTIILSGLSDFQDRAEGQSSTEINKLLVALGATSRLNSDQANDEINNGGQPYRLYFTNHNNDSIYTQGVTNTQRYSHYSGATVLLDQAAVDAGTARYLVKGHATTGSVNNNNHDNNYVPVADGEAVILAHETLANGANIFISGAVFMSDFEISAVIDSAADEPYSNQTIMQNILETVEVELETTSIAEVRQAQLGEVFAVEGWVTAGTAVAGNAFFDTIYIQDETAGITIFPYAEEGLKIGTKIRIVGYVDEYQGDLELMIITSEILDDQNLNIIQPRVVSAEESMDYANNGGSLLKVTGEVIEVISNGTEVSQFRVKDEAGNIATIFINGYIYSATTGRNELAEFVKVGNIIESVGLLYLSPEGESDVSTPSLRVRNTDEIVLIKDNSNIDDGTSTPSDNQTNNVNTGDTVNIGLYAGIMAISVIGGLIFVVVRNKKKKESHESN